MEQPQHRIIVKLCKELSLQLDNFPHPEDETIKVLHKAIEKAITSLDKNKKRS